MAESFAGDDDLVVCLGDNIFEYAEAAAIRSFVDGDDGAAVFVKDVPDPERFGVVVYGEGERVVDVVEKAGVVDMRYEAPPSSDAVVGLYCYSPDVFELIRGLEPSSRGELEITDVNRHYAENGTLACHRVTGWWEDAGTQESLRRDRRSDPAHGRQQARMIEGLLRIPLRRFEDERGWFAEIRRESLLPKQTRQTNLSFSRKGVLRGLHYHERGQDDLFVCLQGMARVVVLDRESGETFTEDIGDDNPVAIYIPGRHAHGFEALTDLLLLLPRHRGVRPRRPGRAGDLLGRPARQAPLEHGHAAPLRAGPAGVYLVTGAGGQLGRALAEEFAADGVVGADARRVGRRAAAAGRARAARRRPPRRRLDERRRRRGRSAGRRRRQRRRDGERRRARRAARLLLDRLRLRRPQARAVRRVGRPEPAVGLRADEAPRRGGGGRAGVDRPLLVALRADRQQLRPHDAAARRGAGRGRGRRRPARVADLRRPPRRGDASGPAPAARRLPRRRRRRRDLGRLRRGDLRGGRPRHARPPDHDGRARRARRRARPTRCCGARRARRRCRTGARACARRSPPSEPGPSANSAAWRATRS